MTLEGTHGASSELPRAVSIREVGPRDGFQNEPEVIPTERKIELIDALARTGLRRLEATSFVRADVIPQLADAAEVLAGIDVPARGERVGADPQRARAGRRARAARARRGWRRAWSGLGRSGQRRTTPGVRRDQRVHVRLGDPQPQERQPLDRRVAGRPGGRAGTGARGGAALRGRDLDVVRLPVRGPRAARAGAGDRGAAARRGRPGDRLRRHDRHGQPASGARVLRGGARAAGRARGEERGADGALPQHARAGPRERAGGAGGGCRELRVELRRARRLPGAGGRDRQHRHRGSRLDAARDGHRDRHRPARRCSRARRRVQEILGRPLGSHTLVAGPVDWQSR